VWRWLTKEACVRRRAIWKTDEQNSVRARLVSTAKRAIAFFGRHDKWATLFASILVFSTFIIKDIWREASKDLVDKIQSGLTKYRSEKNQRTLVDQLREIGVKTGPVPPPPALGVIDPECEKAVYDSLDTINRISELLNNIPDKQDSVEAFDLGNEISKLHLDCAALYEQEHKKDDKSKSAQEVHNELTADMRLMFQRSALSLEVAEFEMQAEFNVERIASQSELRYDHVKKASYFAYALGLIFTLIGKIAGIKGFGGGDS
jgi:hypothetical protein